MIRGVTALLLGMAIGFAQEAVFKVDVRLVRLTATVKDVNGRAVGGLEPSDFTVHDNGASGRACLTTVGSAAGKKVTTIEGLSATSTHPLQQAWVAEQVPQCGYCQSGQIMSAADLLKQNSKPTREQIIEHMSTNICRCGTYQRIVRAIERAAREA